MQIAVSVDSLKVSRRLDLQSKQVRFATAVALTRTAKAVEADLAKQITTEFDRPTRYTQRAVYTDPATKTKLEATVWFKNRLISGNRRTASDILGHHFRGGTRQRKALEEWLERAGYISAGEYVAPGSGAKLDRYGNMSRGQVTQILSQLRAGPDVTQYATSSTRSRRSRARSGELFWSRGGRLARGAWMRPKASRSGAPIPILLVIDTPQYDKSLDLEATGVRISRARFEAEFRTALRVALATAR